MKPIFGGFETRLKFIKFGHCTHLFWIFHIILPTLSGGSFTLTVPFTQIFTRIFEMFSLHWCGGLALLKSAAHVKEFSSFEFAPTDQKKAVFIVGNPALRSSERTIKNIIQNSDLGNIINCNKYNSTINFF